MEEIITTDRQLIAQALRDLREDGNIKDNCDYSHIARKFETLTDILDQE